MSYLGKLLLYLQELLF